MHNPFPNAMEMTNRWDLPQQQLSKTPAMVEFALQVIAVLTQTPVAISTIHHRFMPFFSSLEGWIVFGKGLDSRFLIGRLVGMGGTVAIGLDELQMAIGKLQGDAVALLSVIVCGAYLLPVKRLRTQLTAKTGLLWQCTIGTLLTLALFCAIGDKLFPYSWQGRLVVIFLALICQLLGQGLVAYSLNNLSSGFVALTLLLSPVLSAIEAWAIFSESFCFNLAWFIPSCI